MAELALLLAQVALQIAIQANQAQVINSGGGTGCPEVSGVESNHATERELRLLGRGVAE